MKQWWRTLSLKWKLSTSISLIVLFTVLLYTACFGFLFYRFSNDINRYLTDSHLKMQAMSTVTKDTLMKNLSAMNTQVNHGFSLFFEQMESLINLIAQSEQAARLVNHAALPSGSAEGTPYARLPRKNKPSLNPVLIPYLERLTKTHKEIQYAYFGTPDGAMYLGPVPNTDMRTYNPTTRPWYQAAVKQPDKVVWTDPYIDAITGKPIVTVAKAIVHNGKVIGVAGLDISLEQLTTLVSQIKVGQTGYAYLTDRNGVVLAHPKDKTLIGQNVKEKFSFMASVYERETGTFAYTYQNVEKVGHFVTNPLTGWKLVTVVNKNDLLQLQVALDNLNNEGRRLLDTLKTSQLITLLAMLGVGLILFAVCATGAYLFARSINRRVEQIRRAMNRLAEGDLTQRIDAQPGDEIDELALRFNEMADQLQALIAASRNLSRSIEEAATGLAAVAEETTAQAADIGRTIDEIAEAVAKQAEETEQGAQVVNAFAHSIERVTESANSVQQAVAETSRAGEQGVAAMTNLEQSSEQNVAVAERVTADIQALSEQMGRITSFTTTIKEIAEQTNLLALNAAIEASRAGEHGAGFAVVASEVRKLAEQSSQAAREIEQVVQAIHSQVDTTVKTIGQTADIARQQHGIVQQTKEAFQRILQAVEHIQEKMEGVAAAMAEMNRGKDTFVQTIANISAVSQQTAAGAQTVNSATQEQTRAIEEVAQAAQRLTEMAESLNREIAKFNLDTA
ncbi:methyl-accepting chemotaxis protein [Calditerricola satsumensis]|uniref:Methyl-accepting chemotaxis protein n=1 Tax=Calditerricola satsumensis TaxID=373054 RepID=A0A8J3BAX5_9BACI|nr:methyl-accepting chemotaxis protein [Calditerricola satsumensis]GGK00616.1 methyl-accepting chemotaxis protein [Calditerricola satsumensis]